MKPSTHPYFSALSKLATEGALDRAVASGDVDGVTLRSALYLVRLCVSMNSEFRRLAIDECVEVLSKVLGLDDSIDEPDDSFNIDTGGLPEDNSYNPVRKRGAEKLRVTSHHLAHALREPPCAIGLRALRKLDYQLEETIEGLDDGFAENLSVIARTFGLSETETSLLSFSHCRATNEELASAINIVRPHVKIARVLAPILKLQTKEVTAALAPDGKLRHLGLISTLPRNRNSDLEDSTTPTEPAQTLFARKLSSPSDVSNALLLPVLPSERDLDFSFLGIDGQLVRDIIIGAVRNRERGVNILIHGRPGAGKTEYARSLIRDTGFSAFSVAALNNEGREANRNDRLSAYMLTQRLAPAETGGFVILDEAEDIFPEDDNPLGIRVRNSQSKAWINQLLEENAWPTVWISNRVRHIDPAYLRRFRLVLPFPGLDQAARTTMIGNVLAEIDPGAEVRDALCRQSATTPGLVDSVKTVLETTRVSGLRAHQYASQTVRRYAEAMRLDFSIATPRSRIPYRAEWLHWQSGVPMDRFINRVDAAEPLSLLLHGRPGTGKTAFGDYLARHSGRPLIYRTASDLLSKWLGESEQNVRDMFQCSAPEKTIIFLDECDSLLGAREAAEQRWETSVVNEFLRGIERFEGVFIAATNNLQDLDVALMRRFNAKVELLPLRPEHRVAILESLTKLPLSDTGRREVDRMKTLALGDIHNAMRFLTTPVNEAALLAALTDELRYLSSQHARPIGF